MLDLDAKANPKERSSDRVLVLKAIEGQNILTNTGLIDNRLFSGGNNLHAIMDPMTCIWQFKYESGGLPNPLKQKFTTFSALMQFARQYFAKRGVEIVEILD